MAKFDERLNISMEEDVERERNKAILKGKITFIILLFILALIIISILFIIKIIKFKNQSEEESLNREIYTITKVNNSINFLDKNLNVVHSYECTTSNCNYSVDNDMDGFKDLKDYKIILIKETDKYVLYDYSKRETVSKYYKYIYMVKINNQPKYFIFNENDLYGVLDLQGNIIIPPTYDKLYLESYNTKNNYLLFYLNNKYGVIDYTNNTVVVPNEYENIKAYNNFLLVTHGDKQKLLDYSNKKLWNEDYDLIEIYDNFAVTINNREIYIKDLNERKLNNIPIYTDKNDFENSYAKITYENDKLTIITNTYDKENETISNSGYEFDFDKKEFIKIY